MLTITDCQQGQCIWCLHQTEVVRAQFSDGLSGLLCKKHLWQALKVRCDSKQKPTGDDTRPTDRTTKT